MSVFDWISLALFAGAVLLCTVRGFVRSASGVIRIVGSFMLSKVCGPLLGNLIFRYLVSPQLYDWMERQLSGFVGGAEDALNLSALFAENSEFEHLLHRFGATHLYESLKAQYGSISAGSEESVSEMIESIAAPWAERLSDSFSGMIIFAVAFLILGLLMRFVIAYVERSEVFGVVDHSFGFFLGFISGIFTVVAFCYVVYFAVGALLFVGRSPDAIVELIDKSEFFGRMYAFVKSTM